MPTLQDNDTDSAIDKRYNDGQGSYGDEPSGGHDKLDDFSDTENDEFKKLTDNWDTDMGKKGSLDSPDPNSLAGKNPKLQKALRFAKKRGGIIGLISIFGIGGGILAGFFGPASMLISMTENFSLSNDSSSTAMERRFMKVFGNMTKEDDPICAHSTKNIKCKMGKVSNKALKQLNKKGVTAYFDDGSTYDGKTTKGYPEKNPKGYTIDLKDGSAPKNIPRDQLPGFLANNPKYASKILGIKGAFNLRVKAWAGKQITKRFFSKFPGIDKKGGIADGVKEKYASAKEKLDAATKKLVDKVPGIEKIKGLNNSLKDAVSKKMGDKFEKFKGGGIAYTVAAGTCIASKAPMVISAAVAAAELAPLIPIVSQVVLSPGSKAKATGVETTNPMASLISTDAGALSAATPERGITAEDMDLIGTVLTNKTKDSDGNMTSALDSPYLLSALGVNKNKPVVSEKFSPGYGVLTNPAMKAGRDIGKAVEPTCNVILNPVTMYLYLAVESVVTKSNPIGLAIGLVGGWVVGEAAQGAINWATGELLNGAVSALADSDKYSNLAGRDMGDAIGMSAAAFFSSGGMSRHLPTLKKSQLVAFNDMQIENENQQRAMDIASLSPFDTSSRYTFLGSIVYNARMGLISNGGYSLSSIFSTMASLPSAVSTTTGAATNFTDQYCGYASDFGLDTENAADTPAVNMAGLPCTGITPEQANMSTSDAIKILADKGWTCNPDKENDCPDIKDGATTEDLIPTDSNPNAYIKKDNPLYEYASGSCGNASSGDYLFEVSGCTVPSSVQSGSANGGEGFNTDTYCKSTTKDSNGKETTKDTCEGVKNPTTPEGEDDTRAFQAIAVFLLDFQAAQSINGEDDIESSGGTNSTAGATIDMDNLYNDSTSVACAPGTNEVRNDTGYRKGNPVPVKLCALPDTNDSGKGPALVNSRASGAALAMFNQMKQDLGITGTLQFNDSFRTMQDQIDAKAKYGSQAADPGFSNHQMGIAFDVNGNGQGSCGYSSGITSCEESGVWKWLSANASRYGFKQFSQEWWHWSADGN